MEQKTQTVWLVNTEDAYGDQHGAIAVFLHDPTEEELSGYRSLRGVHRVWVQEIDAHP